MLGEGTRDRIAHVALFSDPTLHLPEGESPGFGRALPARGRRNGVTLETRDRRMLDQQRTPESRWIGRS